MSSRTFAGTTGSRTETSRIRRVALYALLLNLALAALKGGMAVYTDSLALTASAIDSATDAVASLVLLVGLWLSAQKTRKFPLGLYKIENVLSVVVALFIFLAGYEIARQAFLSDLVRPSIPVPVIGLQGVATAVIMLFGSYALRAGRQTGSPTLVAEGRHRQVDALSSLIVMISLVFGYFGINWELAGIGIDRGAAVLVLIFIAHTGWELLSDGMRVLLDASIDFDTLERVREIVNQDPMVAEVESLVGRSAGRFRFLDIRISVRTTDLNKAHAVSERIEERIRESISHVEGVTIHYEPRRATERWIAVPLDSRKGDMSDHFGEAPFFALLKVRTADGAVRERRILENPHQDLDRGKGLRVAEWLVGKQVDEIRLRDRIEHKGPAYVFADAGISVEQTEARDLESLLKEGAGFQQQTDPDVRRE